MKLKIGTYVCILDTILSFMNLIVIYLAVFKWQPLNFISHLSRFRTIAAEKNNVETTYKLLCTVHKLK